MAKIDYNFFEDNGLSDHDKILEILKKKNTKVRGIFNDDETDDYESRQSHGLRLVSIHSESAIPRILTGKENAPSSQHMQALSPKSVHGASPDKINEARHRPTAKSTPRQSLRNSLFKATSVGTSALICSTPFAQPHRTESIRESFLDLSPIRSHVKVTELLTGSNRIDNLAPIEKNLREQYQVDKEPRRKEKSESPRKFFHQRRASVSSQRTKHSEAMEISEDRMSQQNSKIPRLSDKTDLKNSQVNETPVLSQKRRPASDHQELMRKLQAIEQTNDEITSDEEEEQLVPPQVPAQKKNESQKKLSQLLSEEEVTDDEEVPSPPVVPEQAFRKPETPKGRDTSNNSQNSSLRKVVSDNIIESIRSLRPTFMSRNETEQSLSSVPSSQNGMSYRVSVQPKKKSSKEASEKVNEYMSLTNRKKNKKNQNKKRPLFSQSNDSDDSKAESASQNSRRPSTSRASQPPVVQNNESIVISSESEEEEPVQKKKKPQSSVKGRDERAPKVKQEKNKNLPQADSEFGSEEELQVPDRLLPKTPVRDAANEPIQETPKKSRSRTKNKKKEEVVKKPRGRSKKQKSPAKQVESESDEESQRKSEPPQKSRKRQVERESEDESEVQNSENLPVPQETPERQDESESKEESEAQNSENHPVPQETPERQDESESEEEEELQVPDRLPEAPKKSRARTENKKKEQESKKSRGRPKKQKSPVKQVESESEEQNYENIPVPQETPERQVESESEEESEEQNSENHPVPQESPERQDESGYEEEEEQVIEKKEKKRKSLKRKKPDNFDDKAAPSRRKRIIVNNDDSDSESENEDDNDFDVIYVPDNDRYAFRKRRFMKPNFHLASAPSNIRFTYGVITKKDIKEEKLLNELSKKTSIPISTAVRKMGYSNAFRPPASEIRKTMLQLAKEKKRKAVLNHLMKKKDDGSVRSEQTTVQSLAPTEAMHFAFESMGKQTSHDKGTVETTEGYDVAQLDGIEWVSCNNGVEYAAFLAEKGDGLLKLLPGASKQKARSKNSVLKFLLLCGELTFVINGDEKVIKNFGYVNIRNDQNYEIHNRGQKEAIVNFMRYSTENGK